MVQSEKHHNLDRKFKPWRKGKSDKAKPGTLKSQLRGQQRLLPRAQDDEHRQNIQKKIAELESLIAERQKSERERQNAKQSHRDRFLDRQRLTRLERKARQQSSKEELYQIALDMVYVGHFPLCGQPYLRLFRNGQERRLDHGRNVAKRAKARSLALQAAANASTTRHSWITPDLYDMCPSKWSIAEEKQTFGSLGDDQKAGNAVVSDARFPAEGADHSTVLQMAQAIESQLEQEEQAEESQPVAPVAQGSQDDGSDSSSDSDDSSSTRSDDEEADPMTEAKQPGGEPKDDIASSSSDSSSDSSSSDSSSDDSSDEDSHGESQPTKSKDGASDKLEDDDFLTAASTNAHEAFAKAPRHFGDDTVRGDKSKGWATQRQRPGQFKKRRVRR